MAKTIVAIKRTINYTTGALSALTLLSALLLSSPSVSADTSATNDVEITVPISCNLASSTTTAHTATIDAGTYRNDIGESTITATCNDSGGFAIYAIGYSNDTHGNNTLINTTNSTQTIATGTATSGATSNWAMKLTAIDGTYTPTIVGSTLDSEKEQSTPDFSNYIDIPSTYTKVAYRNSNTDQSTGANFKSTYAAYIAPTQYAGTYEGKVKYTLVHPASEEAPIAPVSIEDALAAAGKQKYNDYYKMQDMSASICSTVNTYEEDSKAQLIDTRDNQTYYVAKLLDDKCWMVENLNMAGGTELSSDDTDFDSTYTLPTTNGWTVSNGKLVLPASAAKNENDNDLTDATQFSNVNYGSYLFDYYAFVFNSGNTTNCGLLNQDLPCSSYYSWDTATLGSGRDIYNTTTNADYSICPKGWKLPYRTSASLTDSDFYNLANQYGLDSSTYDSEIEFDKEFGDFYTLAGPGTVPNFLLAGGYSSGSFESNYGGYWSSQANGYTKNALYLHFGARNVQASAGTPDTNMNRGLSVRCLAD